MKIKPLFICPAIASLFLVSCLKKIEDGKNALVEQIAEPPGINCAAGGIKIISGIDENRNHGLDSIEIQQTEFICNGKNALVEQIAEPPGLHCATGGVKIITGMDANQNHKLDSAEIQKTEYVCNGNYDKETIVYFSLDAGQWTVSEQGSIRFSLDFDITNYLADSAVFQADLVTANAAVKASAELYNITNNTVLKNSLLTSNSTIFETRSTTVNFINEFPKGPIKLGMRIKSGLEGTEIIVRRPMLRLYKK